MGICAILQCANATLSPDTGETYATISDIDNICAGSSHWSQGGPGRIVSAVYLGAYDATTPLDSTSLVAFDDALSNGVQCATAGGCVMQAGAWTSQSTPQGMATPAMIVAEDPTGVDPSWRMTCYVEVAVKAASIDLQWANEPNRLNMDSLETTSAEKSFSIVNDSTPGVDDPVVVNAINIVSKVTIGDPACPTYRIISCQPCHRRPGLDLSSPR